MVLLKKEDILHLRGTDGKLLPQKVKLETIEDKELEVEIVPMTRGEIAEIFKDYDKDAATSAKKELEIVERYCINPKLTKEELENFGKLNILQSIVFAIISFSTGIPQSVLLKKKKDAEQGKSDFL